MWTIGQLLEIYAIHYYCLVLKPLTPGLFPTSVHLLFVFYHYRM